MGQPLIIEKRYLSSDMPVTKSYNIVTTDCKFQNLQ
jgi:hypothetical protein